MKDALGGYYTLGRVFVRVIGHPQVMRIATRYGLPRPDPDAVRPQAHGQPARAARGRRDGPDHQRSEQDRAGRLTLAGEVRSTFAGSEKPRP